MWRSSFDFYWDIGVGVIPSSPGHKFVSLASSCDRVVSRLLHWCKDTVETHIKEPKLYEP